MERSGPRLGFRAPRAAHQPRAWPATRPGPGGSEAFPRSPWARPPTCRVRLPGLAWRTAVATAGSPDSDAGDRDRYPIAEIGIPGLFSGSRDVATDDRGGEKNRYLLETWRTGPPTYLT